MRTVHVDDKLYEIHYNGQRDLVKSLESIQPAFIRFSNRTGRKVDLWWRNFNGLREHYATIKPGGHYDINTFLTHPWEFSDAATNENYVINNNIVFRVPEVVAGMRYRTNWNISVPMRTLRFTAMLAVATNLPDANDAVHLDLPMALCNEVQELTKSVNSLEPVIGNQ